MRKLLYEGFLPQKNLGETAEKDMNLKQIELIALDLDGTTLTDSNTLSDEVKTAVEKAIEKGIKIAAASGRPYATMPRSVLDIDGVDYAITSNGAAIYDKHGKRIYQSLLDEKEVLKLLEITKDYDLIFEAFVNGLTYTDKRYTDNPTKYGCSEAYVDYVRSSHGHIEDMRKFIYEHRAELDSIEYICTDREKREKIRRLIANNTDGFYITSSSADFVEFMAKNATKGNALKWLCRKIGISLSDTAACGNGDNDCDMLAAAGVGAAVKNATRLCLESADIILASNNDNGVAELIYNILNSKETREEFLCQ